MKPSQLNEEIDRACGDPAAFFADVKRQLWDNHITQTELAREAGYDLANMNRWLNGRQVPTLRVRLAIAEALERLLED